MPDAVTNEVPVGVLTSVQGQVPLLREDVDTIKTRLTSFHTRIALVHTDMATQSEPLDLADTAG